MLAKYQTAITAIEAEIELHVNSPSTPEPMQHTANPQQHQSSAALRQDARQAEGPPPSKRQREPI